MWLYVCAFTSVDMCIVCEHMCTEDSTWVGPEKNCQSEESFAYDMFVFLLEPRCMLVSCPSALRGVAFIVCTEPTSSEPLVLSNNNNTIECVDAV